MLKRGLLVALLAGLFIYGLTHLFLLRFRTGDVFPQYSTLRADPLGAKAFYAAVAELPHVEVRRNYRPIVKLRPQQRTTLFYAGTPHHAWWGDEELRAVESMAAAGMRVVITFRAVSREPSVRERERAEKAERAMKEERSSRKRERDEKKTPGAKGAGETPLEKEATEKKDAEKESPLEEEPTMLAFSEVAKRWSFAFGYLTKSEDPGPGDRRAELAEGAPALEPALFWGSALHFTPEGDEWQPLYTCVGKPVVIERRYGAGSIVLASDSYFLSNEALRKTPAPQLLTWLLGSSRSVVFDEESHGVRDAPGIASLVRKYQLHGLAAGLLLLAVLFIWKNANPFIPPHEDLDADGGIVRGKEAAEGFTNLLRRSIPPAEIITTCAAEWRKSFHQPQANLKAAILEELIAEEQTRPTRDRNPAALYRQIAAELAKEYHQKK
jgi:hypothetical protein